MVRLNGLDPRDVEAAGGAASSLDTLRPPDWTSGAWRCTAEVGDLAGSGGDDRFVTLEVRFAPRGSCAMWY